MPVLLTLLNNVAETYLQSLKKDLAQDGFKTILLLVSISWASIPIALVLFLLGKFQMPADPLFYLLWLGVAVSASIKFAFFVIGLRNSKFLSANTLPNVAFVTTAIYAVLLLHESLSRAEVAAIIVAIAGTLFFFNWRSISTIFSENKGVGYILFSILLTPLGSIFYKSATLHTSSYAEFLSGRLVMDLGYYSLFFLLVFLLWYRKNPLKESASFGLSAAGIVYAAGWALTNLLDSWLIFLLPISLFTLLGTISIPVSYWIGRARYRERIEGEHVVGAILIAIAVVLSVVRF
jgi:drug/metabolite transporter (DMT)-like permease